METKPETPRVIQKKWGTATVLQETPDLTVVYIEMKPGGYTSMHHHDQHLNEVHVISGLCTCVSQATTIPMNVGKCNHFTISVGLPHRLQTESGFTAFEVYRRSAEKVKTALHDIVRQDEGGIR